MGKGFFDSFDTKTVLSTECVGKLDGLLREEVAQGSSAQEASAKYKDLLNQLLAAQGADIEAACRDNPGFIYIEAAVDMQQFSALLGQTAAAAQCASKAAAAAEVAEAQGEKVKGSWEPPADDDDPETAHDYE